MSSDDLESRLEQVERLYGGDLPQYLSIQSKDQITIRAAQYEGATVQDIVLTPKEVVRYYFRQDELGAGGFSGCRQLASFVTDWRMVDTMAREALAVFRALNREGLLEAAAEYGDDLREGRG